MSARLELFLLCGVLPIAVAILMGAWQNRHRARKRREMKQAALLSEISELKRRYAGVTPLSVCRGTLVERAEKAEADSRRLNWVLGILQTQGVDGLFDMLWTPYRAFDRAAIDAAMGTQDRPGYVSDSLREHALAEPWLWRSVPMQFADRCGFRKPLGGAK